MEPTDNGITAGPVPVPAAGVGAQAHPGLASVRLYWWLSLAVVLADQTAKALVRSHLPPFDSITIVRGFLDFTHVENAGVAFGLLNDVNLPFKAGITAVLAALALLGIGLYARHIRRDEWIARVGLSLILGGAIGNLVDRLWRGSVIDFVDVNFHGWHFWAFNIADASITVGAVLVFLDLLLVTRHAPDSV
jgi:signal peptidase II